MQRNRDPRFSITFKHPTFEKHWGGVESICWSPELQSLYTGSRDASIKRWSFGPDGEGPMRCRCSYEGHSGWVTALLCMGKSANGFLISASYDTTIRLWRPHSEGERMIVSKAFRQHSDYVLQLAGAPAVNKFVSAGLRGDLHVWDLEACVRSMAAVHAADAPPPMEMSGRAEAGSIYAMHCTPDLSVICFAGADGAITLYDPRAGAEVGSLRGHTDNVKALRLSADGTRLVSGSSDRTVRVWDVGAKACTAALEMHGDSVWALDADATLGTVFSGGRDSRVFMTDISTQKTELIGNMSAHVLDVHADWDNKRVWVGTTRSDVRAWSFEGLHHPSQPVHSYDAALLAADPEDSQTHASSARPPLPSYEPASTRPVVELLGIAPLVRHAVFEDKRHILTLDANDVVALWDIVYFKNVKVYEAGRDFEALYKELFLLMLDPVPAWFTSDVQLGVISLHLTNPQSFTAEVYAHALGMRCSDDVKLNYGHEILKSVLSVWKLKCEGRDVERASLDRARAQEPFSLLKASSVRATVSYHEHETLQPWSRDMRDFTGHENTDLPKWAIEAVIKGKYVIPVSNAKLSFSLVPALGSRLPKLDRSRLTAPVILEVRKVVHYVKDKLRELEIDVDAVDITFSEAENQEVWRRLADAEYQLLQVTCNGKLVPFNMTLNTVKRYLCTGRADEDIPLEYSFVDVDNPAPLPSIEPKEISNH